MSRKPNAETNSFDYAEAPQTFNSVETIPNLNASAAFKTDSGKAFKDIGRAIYIEFTEIVPKICSFVWKLEDLCLILH